MENEKDNIKKKIFTKERVILFTIGLLTGAVIATAAFLIYVNVAGVGTSNSGQSMEMPGGTPPEMPDGEDGEGGTPPELPDGEEPSGEAPSDETSDSEDNASSETSQNSQGKQKQGTPPAKPSEKKTKNENS